MADLKISALPTHVTPIAADLLPVVDTVAWATKQSTLSQVVLTPFVTGKHLATRPSFVAGRESAGIPTAIVLGAFSGYSMPIWSTPANQYEELRWRLVVPGRWDGTTDIQYVLYVALSAAETEGDDFRIQLSWSSSAYTAGVITNATKDVTADGDCTAGHTDAYSVFKMTFTVDISEGPISPVVIGDVLSGRLRRVASGGTEISGEIIILDHMLNFVVDKIFKV